MFEARKSRFLVVLLAIASLQIGFSNAAYSNIEPLGEHDEKFIKDYIKAGLLNWDNEEFFTILEANFPEDFDEFLSALLRRIFESERPIDEAINTSIAESKTHMEKILSHNGKYIDAAPFENLRETLDGLLQDGRFPNSCIGILNDEEPKTKPEFDISEPSAYPAIIPMVKAMAAGKKSPTTHSEAGELEYLKSAMLWAKQSATTQENISNVFLLSDGEPSVQRCNADKSFYQFLVRFSETDETIKNVLIDETIKAFYEGWPEAIK